MPNNAPAEPSYEIGHGRPPRHTQFKPGQSGNRKGRPKDSKNITTTIQAELQRRVTITEDGRRKRASMLEVLIKRLINKAAAGDPKAVQVLLNATRAYEAEAVPVTAGGGDSHLDAEDQLVIANVIGRIRAAQIQPSESAATFPANDPPINTSQSENGDTL